MRGEDHPVEQTTDDAGFPLSPGQESLWFLQRLVPDCSAYNMAVGVNLHFAVETDRMAEAVARTIREHGLLRSVYRLEGDEIRRVPAAEATPAPWAVVDCVGVDDEALRRLAVELTRRPFRLDRELPVRLHLLHRAGPDVLLLTAHHLIVDDIGHLAVLRAVLSAYGGRDADGPIDDYDEFVARQRDQLAAPRARAAEKYWRAELAGLESPAPLGHLPRPSDYRYQGAEVVLDLQRDLMAAVRDAAARENVTTFVYLMTVFQLLLYRFTGRTDFLVGYPVTQRSSRRFANSIGYFVNPLPLRATIDPQESFQAVLRRTNKRFWSGLLHREYPSALIPRLIGTRLDRRLPGLVSVLFGMSTEVPDDLMNPGVRPGSRLRLAGLDVSRFDFPEQLGQFDINVLVTRLGDTTRLRFKYNDSVLDDDVAAELAGGYGQLLAAATGSALPFPLRGLRTGSPTR
ncbi:condensation domain-containing protein [Micromonospora sp. CNB394]|uniref:condensation domain-containing protein n=1 Tax=Micromonospora sp. CNB394 TaxID=1169151 RepID=UPI0018C94F01|nr:condensation domain-containing protein [Micromonospora sp. CNB394]